MRVLYLHISAELNSSATQKVMQQINGFNKNGIQCDGTFISTGPPSQRLEPNIEWIQIERLQSNLFEQLRYRWLMQKEVVNKVYKYFNKYDLFYIRFFGPSFGIYKLTKVIGNKIIFETQTTGLDELFAVRKAIVGKTFVSTIFSYTQYFLIPYINEIVFRKAVFRNCKLVVCTTNEMFKEISKFAKKTYLMANGIEIDEVSICENKYLSMQTFNFIFLKGSSNEIDYDGIDRLVQSITKSNYKNQIKLYLCGNLSPNEIKTYIDLEFIEILGHKTQEEIKGLYNEMHAGISTMALYKKGLNEIAPLKTRNYLAGGLPIIYACIDPDLTDNSAFDKFALQFPNDPSLIDIELIISFVKRVHEDSSHPMKIKKLAAKYLSWSNKISYLIKVEGLNL